MFGLCFLGKENETMETSKEEYYVVPEYSNDEYLVDIREVSTVTISAADLYLGSAVTTWSTDIDIDIDSITTNSNSSNMTISNNAEIIVERDSGNIKLIETIQEQQMQIQVLADMISEMVEKGNFKIDWDLDRRVDQKRFIKKLST